MSKKDIRRNFREAVFKRDKNKCKTCDRKDVALDAHHITDRNEIPNGGYVVENGITLCDCPGGCHMKAEKFHITGGKEWEPGFHPNDLYKLINSSLAMAIKAAEKL